MVDDNLIERLWAERTEETTMSREEIANAMRPRLRRSTQWLKSNLWFYLLALIATLVLQGLNLAGYQSNPSMLVVQSLVTAAVIRKRVMNGTDQSELVGDFCMKRK